MFALNTTRQCPITKEGTKQDRILSTRTQTTQMANYRQSSNTKLANADTHRDQYHQDHPHPTPPKSIWMKQTLQQQNGILFIQTQNTSFYFIFLNFSRVFFTQKIKINGLYKHASGQVFANFQQINRIPRCNIEIM